MYLLTADWHLDDNPENEYRWAVFDQIRALRDQHDIARVFILGDMVDRKDRHAARFVNRLFDELDLDCVVLRGNHDSPLRPPAYFEFLPNYVSKPTPYFDARLLLLPFTATPRDDWQAIDLAGFDAVFMHATVTGAVVDNGIVLENPEFPPLPSRVRFYSGDIHHPQRVGNVTYVGAPHPVKFGDDYHCRMLLIDEDSFAIVEEVTLDPPRKLMLDIRSLGDLAAVQTRPGDRVRVRIGGTPDTVDGLAQIEARIAAWAEAQGVILAGTEVTIDTPLVGGVDTSQTPQAILAEFALHEKLSEAMLAVGRDLLKEVEG